jgi:hypothetical protein
MNIDREALAWAAGFVDGEGCFHLTRVRDKRRGSQGRDYRRPSLITNQAGDESGPPTVLLRLHATLGGRIAGPIDRSKWAGERQLWRVLWSHRITSHEGVQAAVVMLWPWLGDIKREQAKAVLLGARAWIPTDMEAVDG